MHSISSLLCTLRQQKSNFFILDRSNVRNSYLRIPAGTTELHTFPIETKLNKKNKVQVTIADFAFKSGTHPVLLYTLVCIIKNSLKYARVCEYKCVYQNTEHNNNKGLVRL